MAVATAKSADRGFAARIRGASTSCGRVPWQPATGAEGAIVVTPLGFQQGARLIAEQAGITCVQLDPGSTPEQYVLRLLQEVMVKLPPDSLQVSSELVGGSLVTVVPYSEA
ncbi:MAG: hypothetical protein QG663_1506 [Thermodesulfobacteriota bacterium]|nr:hypothetical protein [Thermodesulfobacteriota bacterium]